MLSESNYYMTFLLHVLRETWQSCISTRRLQASLILQELTRTFTSIHQILRAHPRVSANKMRRD